MNKIILLCLISVASAGCIGKIKEYDICVYGGTQGGITAEISLAREGASVVLNPRITVYDLEKDPKESKPVRNRELSRKLRGIAVMFQEEMSRDTRKAGESK